MNHVYHSMAIALKTLGSSFCAISISMKFTNFSTTFYPPHPIIQMKRGNRTYVVALINLLFELLSVIKYTKPMETKSVH